MFSYSFLKVVFLCFNCAGIFGSCCCRIAGLWWCHVIWLLLTAVLHWCLGIWVGDNYRSWCWFLGLCFVGWVFCSLISVSSLILWSLWPGFLAAHMTSHLVGSFFQFGDWPFWWLSWPLVLQGSLVFWLVWPVWLGVAYTRSPNWHGLHLSSWGLQGLGVFFSF